MNLSIFNLNTFHISTDKECDKCGQALTAAAAYLQQLYHDDNLVNTPQHCQQATHNNSLCIGIKCMKVNVIISCESAGSYNRPELRQEKLCHTTLTRWHWISSGRFRRFYKKIKNNSALQRVIMISVGSMNIQVIRRVLSILTISQDWLPWLWSQQIILKSEYFVRNRQTQSF